MESQAVIMFSDVHLEILKTLIQDCPEDAPFFTQTYEALSIQISQPKELTIHLLDELCEHGFIQKHPALGCSEDPIELKNKGRAAAESPDYFLNKPMGNANAPQIMGDYIKGNKIGTQNNFNGAASGIIGSSFSDNAQASGNTFQQFNNPDTDELIQLVSVLRQAVTQFPKNIQDDLIIDIDDVEAEIKKTETERNSKKLKKRLLALATAGSLIATPISGMTDFINTAIDLATKVGIELPLP